MRMEVLASNFAEQSRLYEKINPVTYIVPFTSQTQCGVVPSESLITACKLQRHMIISCVCELTARFVDTILETSRS